MITEQKIKECLKVNGCNICSYYIKNVECDVHIYIMNNPDSFAPNTFNNILQGKLNKIKLEKLDRILHNDN